LLKKTVGGWPAYFEDLEKKGKKREQSSNNTASRFSSNFQPKLLVADQQELKMKMKGRSNQRREFKTIDQDQSR